MSFEEIVQKRRLRPAHVRLLTEMHKAGAPLSKGDLRALHDAGVLSAEQFREASSTKEAETTYDALDRYVLNTDAYIARCVEAGLQEPKRDILKEDWCCDEPAQVDPKFAKFILSHYKRFCDLGVYEPFFLYVRQAQRWMQDPEPDLDEMTDAQRWAYYNKEFDRFCQNLAYALWRVVWYKESSLPGGEGKYEPTLAMFFLLYLINDGRSGFIGKGRQITSTTTIAAVCVIMMITRRNFHAKLIACDLDTTEEIFEDKVKYAFGRLPNWLKPIVSNDKDNLFRVLFNRSASKGSKKAMSSKVAIVAPKLSAINGGAPDFVAVDEAPFLDIFTGMVEEGRPTMFAKGKDGELRMLRQLWAWGTGGRSSKGGGEFEKAHRALFKRWESGVFVDGIVPIFLDWTCRPGMTEEMYLKEKARVMAAVADGSTQADFDKALTLFRQHYPSSLDDMYSVSANTLVPPAIIYKESEKITALPLELRPQYGHYDPVFSESAKMPEHSYFPYKVVGAKWVPSPEGSVDACLMFMRPERSKDRYYQGTDPIMSNEGLSMHASAIWDAYLCTIPCIVNTRFQDPYQCYLQSKLMGIYYRNEGQAACMELVENNIGRPYIKWVTGPEWGLLSTMVTQFFLPDYLRGGGDDIGWNSKEHRKFSMVQSVGLPMLEVFGSNIYIPELWSQLRFFVGKTSGRNRVLWGTDNAKQHCDDVVDASFAANACRLCFPSKQPIILDMEGQRESQRKSIKPGKYIYDPTTHTVRLAVPVTEVQWKAA